MYSAWRRQHELAEDACPECQGSRYVPVPNCGEPRIVNKCPECEGTGKKTTKKAA